MMAARGIACTSSHVSHQRPAGDSRPPPGGRNGGRRGNHRAGLHSRRERVGTMHTRRALVLGVGGVTGIAWETGILLGLERRGIHLRDADLIVGTSAGSTVAAQVAGPTPLEELYAAQIEGRVDELPGKLGIVGVFKLIIAMRGTKDEQRALAKVGTMALACQDCCRTSAARRDRTEAARSRLACDPAQDPCGERSHRGVHRLRHDEWSRAH